MPPPLPAPAPPRHATAMSISIREDTAASSCLPADQPCLALSWQPPPPPPQRRACCAVASYLEVLGISFGSLFAILLVLCVVRFYLARREVLRRDAAAEEEGAAPAKKRSAGLSAEAIAALPEFLYRKSGGGEGEVECAVCLADMAEGEAARRLPKCGHLFHRGCVDAWLGERWTCPMCRTEVLGAEGGKCTEKAWSTQAEGGSSAPAARVANGERDLEAQ